MKTGYGAVNRLAMGVKSLVTQLAVARHHHADREWTNSPSQSFPWPPPAASEWVDQHRGRHRLGFWIARIRRAAAKHHHHGSPICGAANQRHDARPRCRADPPAALPARVRCGGKSSTGRACCKGAHRPFQNASNRHVCPGWAHRPGRHSMPQMRPQGQAGFQHAPLCPWPRPSPHRRR